MNESRYLPGVTEENSEQNQSALSVSRPRFEQAISQIQDRGVSALANLFRSNKLTCPLTHSWSWALLENLPIVQPLKNFPAFYGTRRFIAVFTRALHWSLYWARSIQSIPSQPIYLRSILILSTHLRLGLPNGLSPSGIPTNSIYAFLFSPFVLHALPISSSLNKLTYDNTKFIILNNKK
jgi:hypothetical protein